MKKQIGVNDIFFPVPPALIVAGKGSEANIVTVSWTGMVSSIPPTLSISIHKSRYSLELLRREREFSLNIPSADMVQEVDFCGMVSGKDVNKWEKTKLTKINGVKIETPLIKECPFNIECRIVDEKIIGEYVTFFAEIEQLHIDSDKTSCINRAGIDVDKVNPIVYFPTIREYRKTGEKIGEAFKEGNKIKEGSREYFNNIAEEWDSMRKGFFSENVRKEAVKKSGIESGMLAADIGSGSGFITEELIKKGAEVIAVDQSEEMISILKRKYNGIKVLKGNGENLPVEESSVDAVFANMYLHHVENPETAIKEMVRILKPKGKLIITDLDKHEYHFLQSEQYDRWLGFDREDIKRWYENAGLKNISVESSGDECCADSNCGCSSAKITIFMAYGEKQEEK